MSQIFFDTIDNDQYDFMTEWNTAVMENHGSLAAANRGVAEYELSE